MGGSVPEWPCMVDSSATAEEAAPEVTPAAGAASKSSDAYGYIKYHMFVHWYTGIVSGKSKTSTGSMQGTHDIKTHDEWATIRAGCDIGSLLVPKRWYAHHAAGNQMFAEILCQQLHRHLTH